MSHQRQEEMSIEHQELRALKHIALGVCRIADVLERLFPPSPPKQKLGVQIKQVIKGAKMSITGTPAGGSSTFEADALLAGIADPAGFPAGTIDTWTCDDPQAVIGPDSGPDVNEAGSLDQVVISIPLADTQGSAAAGSPGSYNLTVSVQLPAVGGVLPAPLTNTVNVPITAPIVLVPSGVTINQVA